MKIKNLSLLGAVLVLTSCFKARLEIPTVIESDIVSCSQEKIPNLKGKVCIRLKGIARACSSETYITDFLGNSNLKTSLERAFSALKVANNAKNLKEFIDAKANGVNGAKYDVYLETKHLVTKAFYPYGKPVLNVEGDYSNALITVPEDFALKVKFVVNSRYLLRNDTEKFLKNIAKRSKSIDPGNPVETNEAIGSAINSDILDKIQNEITTLTEFECQSLVSAMETYSSYSRDPNCYKPLTKDESINITVNKVSIDQDAGHTIKKSGNDVSVENSKSSDLSECYSRNDLESAKEIAHAQSLCTANLRYPINSCEELNNHKE